jgi:NADH:ubiquinone oxidoreductase subunit 3 (subunit A)
MIAFMEFLFDFALYPFFHLSMDSLIITAPLLLFVVCLIVGLVFKVLRGVMRWRS